MVISPNSAAVRPYRTRALDLHLDVERIDDVAAIDAGGDALDLHFAAACSPPPRRSRRRSCRRLHGWRARARCRPAAACPIRPSPPACRARPENPAGRRAACGDIRTGPRPAAWASSSMKLSTAKAFCEEPTERQNITGTCVFLSAHADVQRAGAIGNVDQPFDGAGARRRSDLAPSERARDRPDRGAKIEAGRRAVDRRARL